MDLPNRRFDLVLQQGANGFVLALDFTPATAMLTAIGTDRRAEPDDTLPDGSTNASVQQGAGFTASLPQRRGATGDRLATDGSRAGSRLWLLSRAKLGDADGGSSVDTLQLAEGYATEATDSFPDRYGSEVTVAASRVATNAMLVQVQAGQQLLTIRQTA